MKNEIELVEMELLAEWTAHHEKVGTMKKYFNFFFSEHSSVLYPMACSVFCPGELRGFKNWRTFHTVNKIKDRLLKLIVTCSYGQQKYLSIPTPGVTACPDE